MGNGYLGKTNKELIIEVIGEIKGIKKELRECRPVCFNNKDTLIKIQAKEKNWPNIFPISIIIWILQKLKGG